MKFKTWIVIVVFGFVLNFGSIFGAQMLQKDVIKRFALAVGANDGGKERVRLRYALTDAEAFVKVMKELGGIAEEDTLFLGDPKVKTFYTEMARFQEKVAKAQEEFGRVEVFFYYSGHSDENFILLGEERVSYKDLREALDELEADARIAILDSCASGAFTRIKGGKKHKPFLVDSAYNMKGFAFMSSSSATEASQESDLIRGSFFTHYLISGLRGAADVTQDGRVTLNEAYQFAFNETLAHTAKTLSGPQHPYYDIEMAGTGDVVVTDVRKGSVLLVLTEDIEGKIFIHDADGHLVVELTKPLGRPVELGLEEGEYRIINIRENRIFEAKIDLVGEVHFDLKLEMLESTEIEYTTPRGAREEKLQRDTVLQGKSTYRPFVEIATKSTSVNGQYGLLMGGIIGVTVNRIFSMGVGGFGKVNIGGDPPGYRGLFFAYNFSPDRKFNFRARVLAGGGTSYIGDQYFVLEPGVDVVMNLSRIVRIWAGLSYPLVDKPNSGLDSPVLGVGFQIGK
jgi:hypothetical protein